VDLQQTRLENQQRLSPHLDEIRRGQMTEALEPFAKAYLGMYYQLDNSVPPRLRVEQLSGGELYSAIIDGFESVLADAELPTPEAIGRAAVSGQGMGRGYILLAALEEWCGEHPKSILELRDEALQAVLCYQLVYGDYQYKPWLETLLQRRQALVGNTLRRFWRPYLAAGKELLPGLNGLLRGHRYPDISGPLAMGLLEEWSGCDPYTLRRLLQTAMACGFQDELRAIARRQSEALDAADIKRKIYWLATAYLLDPEANAQALSLYAGRTKEKVLRLMDFSVAVLMDERIDIRLSAMDLARLLRIIAPIIVRNEGRGGLLDEDSSKVLWLFETVRGYPQAERDEAVAWLRTVRVMRAYADILDEMAAL
jgi:hypothetical protein